jgi:hypothetical protein
MRHSIAILVAGLCFASCGDDDGDAGTLTIHLDHQVAGQELNVDPVATYTNAAGNVYSVSLLEYIISDVDLVNTSGATHRLRDEHYRNAAIAATGSFTSLDVPAGEYHALRFTFGVSAERNITGSLPNTTDFANMEWPTQMGGGYHYMRLEGLFDNGGSSQAFLSHTGPSGGGDFSFVVELPLSMHVDGGDSEVHVVMDLNEWFEDPHVYDFAAQGMIMGNADAQLTHQDNGQTVFHIGSAGAAHDE